MKKGCFVGFDTSNYTTSVALCDADGNIVANLKTPLPVAEGERGLRQSDAVFAHVKNLPTLCDELGKIIANGEYDIKAIGVSSRPRSVEGSYMPCFLSGVAAAHAFAAAVNAPIEEFSHQDGHVMAALYSSGTTERLIGKDFMAFHVSGGTTEVLLARPEVQPFELSLIGETADINAGQAIDRTGVMMGLKFPCGAQLEGLARDFEGKRQSFKISVRADEETGKICCNLSGVENLARKLYFDTDDKNAVAAFVFDFICATVYKMAEKATEKYGEMPIVFAGGVMSNKLMREKLSSRFEAYFAEPAFSADNASGIALLCRRKFQKLEK